MKIKKGDTVLVISGKDRGKRGKVLQAFPKENRVFVEGVNLHKKHKRPKTSGEKGQVITLPGAVSASSVKLLCPKCGKPTRVGYKLNINPKGDKFKIRACKKCSQEN